MRRVGGAPSARETDRRGQGRVIPRARQPSMTTSRSGSASRALKPPSRSRAPETRIAAVQVGRFQRDRQADPVARYALVESHTADTNGPISSAEQPAPSSSTLRTIPPGHHRSRQSTRLTARLCRRCRAGYRRARGSLPDPPPNRPGGSIPGSSIVSALAEYMRSSTSLSTGNSVAGSKLDPAWAPPALRARFSSPLRQSTHALDLFPTQASTVGVDRLSFVLELLQQQVQRRLDRVR